MPRALPSRTQFASPEDFVAEFCKTITPGVIARKDFIPWSQIQSESHRLLQALEFYSRLDSDQSSDELIKEMALSLLSADNPDVLVEGGFLLLGHTGRVLITQQDCLDRRVICEQIKAEKEPAARQVSEALISLGLDKVLAHENLVDVLLGVHIGLATHSRKNAGGKAFSSVCEPVLREIVESLRGKHQTCQLLREKQLSYSGVHKTLDFAVALKEKVVAGIELNFYTGVGSKPTEIKRAYDSVATALEKEGIVLIWITDGHGYNAMKRSLADAYRVLPNIYNLSQARAHLRDDLLSVLESF